nr:WW domain-binding protein 11-like [Neodiprion pinetum]
MIASKCRAAAHASFDHPGPVFPQILHWRLSFPAFTSRSRNLLEHSVATEELPRNSSHAVDPRQAAGSRQQVPPLPGPAQTSARSARSARPTNAIQWLAANWTTTHPASVPSLLRPSRTLTRESPPGPPPPPPPPPPPSQPPGGTPQINIIPTQPPNHLSESLAWFYLFHREGSNFQLRT